MEGFIGIKPRIKSVRMYTRAKIIISLHDGRQIIVPLKHLPSLRKVKPLFRRRFFIIDDTMFTAKTCTEVYHLEQILGMEKDYQYLSGK